MSQVWASMIGHDTMSVIAKDVEQLKQRVSDHLDGTVPIDNMHVVYVGTVLLNSAELFDGIHVDIVILPKTCPCH